VSAGEEAKDGPRAEAAKQQPRGGPASGDGSSGGNPGAAPEPGGRNQAVIADCVGALGRCEDDLVGLGRRTLRTGPRLVPSTTVAALTPRTRCRLASSAVPTTPGYALLAGQRKLLRPSRQAKYSLR
jgi:hypothetical protein